MRFTEIIIGWIGDELAEQFRRQGKRLRFLRFSHAGTPVHEVVRAR